MFKVNIFNEIMTSIDGIGEAGSKSDRPTEDTGTTGVLKNNVSGLYSLVVRKTASSE